MCQHNSQLHLCENERGYISWCKNCQLYSLMYETCCIAFTKGEYKAFRSALQNLKQEHFVSMHSQRETVFLRSARGCMGICLTRGQVADLIEMFDEASHMHRVFSLVYR